MANVQPAPDRSGSNVSLIEKAQLSVSSQEVSIPDSGGEETNYLVVSPYTEKDHLLDLRTLDKENGLLAKALVHMQCLRPDYATAPYTDSFNWSEVMEELHRLVQEAGHEWKETSFYVVAFRSQIPPTTIYSDLGALDKAAHAEATASGGFLKYWFGEPDKDGNNLATCLWRSRQDAQAGGRGPAHRRAAAATSRLYTKWMIDRHRLIVRDGLRSWDIIDWAD